MTGLFHYFDEIHCINLDKRADRWVQAENEFRKLEIIDRVKRFSGIEKPVGEIGCRESHLSIIDSAHKRGLSSVLILEDDLRVISIDRSSILDAITELKSTRWNLYYLGANVDPNRGRPLHAGSGLVKTNFAYSTYAYAIHNRIFEFILNFAREYDVFLNEQVVSQSNSFIFNPMVCLQRDGYSDIQKVNMDYKWMLDLFNIALKQLNDENH